MSSHITCVCIVAITLVANGVICQAVVCLCLVLTVLFVALQPPELHPEAFPELLANGPGPLVEYDNQIRMEALIMRNLDAALQDKPKPYMFEPTAGGYGFKKYTQHKTPQRCHLGCCFVSNVLLYCTVM